MTARVRIATKQELSDLISSGNRVTLSAEELETFQNCLRMSEHFFAGWNKEELVCVWGLIPPTLLSDTAYVWLYVLENISHHQFALVRNSQIAMGEMLKLYPRIIGHCLGSAERSMRWLRWLGAEFAPREGKLIPFEIKEKSVG